jgi:ABC-2 type transport system ATP-binding protein
VIEATGLVKRYGAKTAVAGIDFRVRPGVVTGFLGPNGAGKSTTMRMIVGLDAPTAGTVLVNGLAYREHRAPLHEVGALLEAKAAHRGRTARNHLRVLAATTGVPTSRVDEVLDLVGLSEVGRRRAGSFSLGMGQRLGVASALLGDPKTLILDEPVNGLDPDGVRWIRHLLRGLADQGRTVFLSSHLMSEMAMTADHVIIVGKGKLLRDMPMAEFIAESAAPVVRVRSPEARRLAELVQRAASAVREPADGTLEVEGVSSDDIGRAAASAGITLFELAPVGASLEEAYMALTASSLDFRSPSAAASPGADGRPETAVSA